MRARRRSTTAQGERPEACDHLERIARTVSEEARVWRGGADIPEVERGIKVLGTPLEHPVFVQHQLARVRAHQQVLLEPHPCNSGCAISLDAPVPIARPPEPRISSEWCPPSVLPALPDLTTQHCGSVCAGCWVFHQNSCEGSARAASQLPLAFGGLGLRSAERTRTPAYWASWADSLSMIQQRHPSVAGTIVEQMAGESVSVHLRAASAAAAELNLVPGFEVPGWLELARGVRPALRNVEEFEPGCQRTGWQHEAAIEVEREFRDVDLFPRMAEHERALVRSQGGPMAGMSLAAVPSNPHTRIEPQLFRVLLLRRLRLPLPLSSRACRCGRLLDVFGHHRASCALAGVLGRRGFAVESITARICREAGGRVSTNVLVRDLDLPVPVNDARRLEVVVDGLPLFGGAQLAVDSTLVSALHCDGSARRGAGDRDGVALVAARRRKERTYPELVRPGHRARLVVIAGEVAGRWSEEAASFLRHLAKARSRCEPAILQKRAEQGWRLRWGSMLACAAARAFAQSLLERRVPGGGDGPTPSVQDVLGEWRFAGLECGQVNWQSLLVSLCHG